MSVAVIQEKLLAYHASTAIEQENALKAEIGMISSGILPEKHLLTLYYCVMLLLKQVLGKNKSLKLPQNGFCRN